VDAIGLSDLDPCGYKNGEVVKCAHTTYSLPQDGLKLEWRGTVYCNPPYNELAVWLKKCRRYHQRTKLDVIVLMFTRTETEYFQEECQYATGFLFISGRLHFLTPGGEDVGAASTGSVLVAFGESAFRRICNVRGIPVRVT
jgi:hypothetical protein